jgi:uncharacterized glyoxalase superfamily protein PhnB
MSETAEFQFPKVETKGGVIAYLNLDGALKAAAFYEKAFAATLAFNVPPDDHGRTMHVHLYINGSSVMLGDFYPEHGHPFEKVQAITMTLQVTDTQAWFKRAVDAGCAVVTEPQKMFWGDIWAQVRDPFGVIWAMNQPD